MSMMSMLRTKKMLSALLRVDEGRWSSRAQAEGKLLLCELCKDSGEVVHHGSHLFKKGCHKGFEVRDTIVLLKRKVGRWCRSRG
jgi:hypothetical protein